MHNCYLDELNKQQKEAIFSEKNRVCVVAGAGCGKTRTLIGKIIFILLQKKLNQKEY